MTVKEFKALFKGVKTDKEVCFAIPSEHGRKLYFTNYKVEFDKNLCRYIITPIYD